MSYVATTYCIVIWTTRDLEIYATIVTPYCGFVLDLDWKRGLVLGLGWKHVDGKSEMHMGREVRWDGGEIFSF